jgi:hypothetical protein
MLRELLSVADVLLVQFIPIFTDAVGVKLAATEAVPLPEAFTALIFIEYVVQLVKPLLIIIGLAVIAGDGVTQLVPPSVEYW